MKRQRLSGSRLKHQLVRAGGELRALRERGNLTMRQVHLLSRRIAARLDNNLLEIFPSRLHLIERGKHVPSLYRIHALALIYHVSLNEVFRCYGIASSSPRTRQRPSVGTANSP